MLPRRKFSLRPKNPRGLLRSWGGAASEGERDNGAGVGGRRGVKPSSVLPCVGPFLLASSVYHFIRIFRGSRPWGSSRGCIFLSNQRQASIGFQFMFGQVKTHGDFQVVSILFARKETQRRCPCGCGNTVRKTEEQENCSACPSFGLR